RGNERRHVGGVSCRLRVSRRLAWARPWTPQAEPPWHYQQVRTVKRGTEYQPKNIKRKRTHGWIKRISTQGGIEVILRRMLKGRKSLSH
uniref:Large ribosomal subunit protein bL34m n=1 Tax=Denticeps clupeoides TaxID=299321 RepID=A0AAY4AK12_9TELE